MSDILRANPRFSHTCKIEFDEGNIHRGGTCSDLSMGGLKVLCDTCPRAGSALDFAVFLDESSAAPVRLRGLVANAGKEGESFYFGVQIIAMSENDREAFHHFLRNLARK